MTTKHQNSVLKDANVVLDEKVAEFRRKMFYSTLNLFPLLAQIDVRFVHFVDIFVS